MTNSTSAITNTIFAIPTAVPAIPPKPKMPAISAMIKSVMTRLNISALRIFKFPSSNLSQAEWFRGGTKQTKRFRCGWTRKQCRELKFETLEHFTRSTADSLTLSRCCKSDEFPRLHQTCRSRNKRGIDKLMRRGGAAYQQL